jgi:hypothetical protein
MGMAGGALLVLLHFYLRSEPYKVARAQLTATQRRVVAALNVMVALSFVGTIVTLAVTGDSTSVGPFGLVAMASLVASGLITGYRPTAS